ncbi:MAG: hypothetical protein QME05_04370 [Candidatus Margulisbacteria bacterium]|nr:hypothetical protein [Candidatus Margulisiibacteriota bacterium]
MTDINVSSLSSISAMSSSALRDQILTYYGDFRSVLGDTLLTLADTNQSTIDFLGYQDLDKEGTAFSYLLQDYLSESEYTLSQLLDIYKFMQTIETKFNNTAVG